MPCSKCSSETCIFLNKASIGDNISGGESGNYKVIATNIMGLSHSYKLKNNKEPYNLTVIFSGECCNYHKN